MNLDVLVVAGLAALLVAVVVVVLAAVGIVTAHGRHVDPDPFRGHAFDGDEE